MSEHTKHFMHQFSDMNMINGGMNNNDVNNHMAFALAAGMGSTRSTQGPAASNGTRTMEYLQHFMASKLLDATRIGAMGDPWGNQNRNGNRVPPFGSTSYMQDLQSRILQTQQQIMEISRQSESQTEMLMRHQRELQVASISASQGFPFPTASLQQRTSLQYNPVSSNRGSQSCSSHASLNPNPVSVGDSRASHGYGSFTSTSSLDLFNTDQKRNASNEIFQVNVPQDQEVTRPESTDDVMFVPTKDDCPTNFVPLHQRNSSLSSFDALMTAIGSDLDDIQKETENSAVSQQDASQIIHLPQAQPNPATDQTIQKAPTTSCVIEKAIKQLSSALNTNPYITNITIEEPLCTPQKILDQFLNEYGEEGKKARNSLLTAIHDSELSLSKIHEWDRSQGIRKCSNRTVVKTRQSRARIKAFLQGKKPPKEPKSRRKVSTC
eukprot:scaffold4598_cov73-Cyclotella_meneghiniana.AAC.14